MKRSTKRGASAASALAGFHWKQIAVIAVLSSALAVGAGALTYRQTAQKNAPLVALAMSPGNAKANNVMARSLLRQEGLETDPARLLAFSRRSIESQPINPDALSNAGMAKALAGDTDAARTLFRLAEKTSKRNALANVWLFEDMAKAGQVAEGLALLDRALRVEDGVREAMFPALTKVVSDPLAAAEMAPVFAQGPDWAEDFADYAATDADAAAAVAAMITAHPQTATILTEQKRRQLVLTLTQAKRYDEAKAMYARFAKPSGSASIAFADRGNWHPFDWQLGSSGSLSVFDGADGSGIEFTIAGGGQQQIASRLLTLDPGTYSLSSRAAAVEGNLADLGLRIRLSCANGAAGSIGEFRWLNNAAPVLQESFTIPADCPLQQVDVLARGQRDNRDGELADIKIAKQ